LAVALGMSGATVSHHTDLLLNAGVLTVERRAHRTYFILHGAVLKEMARGASSRLFELLAANDMITSDAAERTSEA
jgi:hypothetical protein